ncbi:hypothetical protein MASR1M74_12390 [Lentimicrobium sp.]
MIWSQLSGIVVSGDSLRPVPYVSIRIKGYNRGTISDFYGFFSLVARKGETVQFSAVGYKKSQYRIPDTLKGNHYSMVQIMTNDTIFLRGNQAISLAPRPMQFKQALCTPIIQPDDELTIAQKNLNKMEMRERARQMPMDGSMNYRNYMNQQVDKLYYYGQTQPITVFNPFAWAEFIKPGSGDVKRKINVFKNFCFKYRPLANDYSPVFADTIGLRWRSISPIIGQS